jgi:Na+/glutamate symporter
MPLWQRLLITLAAIIVTSFLAGYLALSWMGFELPSYISGLIGGIVALPVWELLGRIRPRRVDAPDY